MQEIHETLPNLADLMRTVSEGFHKRRGTMDMSRTTQASLLPGGFGSPYDKPSQTFFPRIKDNISRDRGQSTALLKTTGFRAKLEEISEESSHQDGHFPTGQTPVQLTPIDFQAESLDGGSSIDEQRHSLEEQFRQTSRSISDIMRIS